MRVAQTLAEAASRTDPLCVAAEQFALLSVLRAARRAALRWTCRPRRKRQRADSSASRARLSHLRKAQTRHRRYVKPPAVDGHTDAAQAAVAAAEAVTAAWRSPAVQTVVVYGTCNAVVTHHDYGRVPQRFHTDASLHLRARANLPELVQALPNLQRATWLPEDMVRCDARWYHLLVKNGCPERDHAAGDANGAA
jgi:hypothetical protein